LINTPLADLLETGGIGVRKVQTLIMLLNRAAQPLPPGALAPPDSRQPENPAARTLGREAAGDVDAAMVSEALWAQWQATVSQHGLEHETLGRLASSLQDMPRVIWQWPLSSYLQLSLNEIRDLKTHGEKRVTALLDVFGSLHAILAHAGSRPHLAVDLVPRAVVALEAWVMRWLQAQESPALAEVQKHFVTPLLDQVRVDANSQVSRLAERRMSSTSASVRQAAERLGLTRARVYQLLDEVADIVSVRWPIGQFLVGKLREKLHNADTEHRALVLFDAACELFFATRGGGSARSSGSTSPSSGTTSQSGRPNRNRMPNSRSSRSEESDVHDPRLLATAPPGSRGNGHSPRSSAAQQSTG
jgi:hypothetical protein